MITFVCEGLAVWSLVYHMSHDDASFGGTVLSWMAVVLMTIICITVVGSTVCPPTSPEKRIEFEMKQFLKPPGAPQS